MPSVVRAWSPPGLWTVAHQAPLSSGFSRQEYWRGSSRGSSFRGSSRPRDWICGFCVAGEFFTHWAIRQLNETLSSASPWPQMNVIRCDRCHGNPGEGDKDGQLRGNDFVVFSHFVSRPLCSRYRWLPSRRGGVSGFGVPPASMRRAADQNGGGGRHNWGQGFRLGDQWRSGLRPAHQPLHSDDVSSQLGVAFTTEF